MRLRSENPYRSLRSGLMGVYPPLESDIRCDAVIIGGGITGAVVADALVRAGVSCAIVDRRDIGQGSTSASTALLQYEIDTPLHELIGHVGRTKAERAYQLGVEAIQEIASIARASDCGFAARPSLLLAKHKKDLPFLSLEWKARQAAGLHVSFVGEDELRRRYRLNRSGAIRSETAAEVDPYRLTHNLLARNVQSGGLRVFDRTTFQGYCEERNGVRVTTDRGAVVSAKKIIFASGYETKPFLPAGLVRLKTTYAVISEPQGELEWWVDRGLLWETGNRYLYARTTHDQRILVGGEDDTRHGSQCYQILGRKTATLRGKFEALTGRSFEAAFSWSGVFGSTKDGLAYMGEHPSFPRALFALGFGGNGITFSVIAAGILRDVFLGVRNRDAAIFSFDR